MKMRTITIIGAMLFIGSCIWSALALYEWITIWGNTPAVLIPYNAEITKNGIMVLPIFIAFSVGAFVVFFGDYE
jgi:hypothetical protein